MLPSKDQAVQFVIMLSAGLPAAQAILYFVETEDPAELAMILAKWTRSRAVRQAQQELMGKSWQDMTLDEKIKYALDQHYAQLAFVLYSNHFGEVSSGDLVKLNTARQALESKLAGMAGKGDALSEFFADLKAGKLNLRTPLANPKVN